MEQTSFINVDLNVESAEDLHPLADALAASTVSLHCDRLADGRWRLCLELLDHPPDAEAGVVGFLDALAELSDNALRIWRDASKRSFNVGIEATSSPWWRATFTPETLRRVADHDAVLEITVYGPTPST